MPRHPRVSPDGYVQHVINRGDHRETIFHKPADFAAFIAFMAESAERVAMRIVAYCIMRNHFHLLLWPYHGSDLSAYMQTLMNLHIPRYLRHYPPASPGHIYQGRYHNVIVQHGAPVLKVARYVEANPVAAGLVERAEDYEWSSAWRFANGENRPVLDTTLIARSDEWRNFVNEPLSAENVAEIEQCLRKGRPIGDPAWTGRMIDELGLKHTTRGQGRPRTYEVTEF
jgi:putative transposase